ncbi:APC family permease [Sulfurovum riftiae]|uniref:Amino acid transporter n=1 Tax=Sulfurovum riftiae TaxID=1630136 RepID=A0A151CI74_9BACT|nr:APC family permease [Sulfurovum riftiae]KYJ87240.1 amino acid transporter [Sulfurovum riftiae]
MNETKKAFGLWSAVFLGIGSMVGAGIFIVIGQAGAIAGNLVWLSFVFGGVAALLSGYSLAKLAITYPSRGGIVEYLVQSFGEGVFSGSAGVLFYFSQLIAIAAVAKSFGAYAGTFMHGGSGSEDLFALGVVGAFILINLVGASLVARSESFIVAVKLTVLVLFAGVALFYIDPKLLSGADMPSMNSMFFAVGLTFFAYQGFSVITNTVEDMKDPLHTMLKAMVITILLVGVLYIVTSIAVLGNLPLSEVIKAKDYALAQAAEPIFGHIGFKVMAATALLATASAINATLYAATEIGYTLAKEGNLPKAYIYNVHNSFEGLIISGALIIPMILFLNLSQVTTIAALVVLVIQGLAHVGHLLRIKETGANFYLVLFSALSMFGIAGLTLYHTATTGMPLIALYLFGAFIAAFAIEIILRLATKRVIRVQTDVQLLAKLENNIEKKFKKMRGE